MPKPLETRKIKEGFTFELSSFALLLWGWYCAVIAGFVTALIILMVIFGGSIKVKINNEVVKNILKTN